MHLFRAMFQSEDFVLASELTKVKHTITEHPGLGERVLEGCMTVSETVYVRRCVHLYVSLPHSLTCVTVGVHASGGVN